MVVVIETLGQLPRIIIRRRYVPGLYRWAERRARLHCRSRDQLPFVARKPSFSAKALQVKPPALVLP